MRRKEERSRDAAGQASRSWARDEIGNQHSGAASQSEEIHMGTLAQWERGGLEPQEPRRVLPASPAAGPRRRNAARGEISSAERLRSGGCGRRAQWGPGPPSSPAAAGCQGRAQPQGTQQGSTRGGGGRGAGVQRRAAAGSRAAIWQQHGQGGGCVAPASGPQGAKRGAQRGPAAVQKQDRCGDSLKQFLSGLGSHEARAPTGSPCSDAQCCQRPRAGDLLEAVGCTHPDEVFL